MVTDVAIADLAKFASLLFENFLDFIIIPCQEDPPTC